MTCPGVRLDAYLDRELEPADRAGVEGHIEACPACARELGRLAAASSAVRGWQPLPRAPSLRRAVIVLAAVAALVLLLLRGGSAPSRPDEIRRLAAGETVRHTGARTYLAQSLDREARVLVGETTLAARHAFFRIEEEPMERRRKLVGGAVVATTIAVAIWWGTAEVTHRSGRRVTLGPGEHVVEEPAAAEERASATPRAPETPFDPATGFTGLVLDSRDIPVEGATIEVTASSEYVGRAPDAVATSGRDGRFECGPASGSNFFVSARKTGVGAAGRFGFPRPGADLVLRLVPGARLLGRVHEGDAPVPGVLLTAQMVGGQWAFARAVTDADGRFVLEHLDPEEATLWGRAPEHEQINLRPPLKIGETTVIDIPLERSAIFRGRVLDEETGAPLDLVYVRQPMNTEREARLLGDGRFEIPEGLLRTTLNVLAKGYPETQVFYPPGEKERVFRISRGRLVHVSVVDGAGSPVLGARVAAQPGWIPSHIQRGFGGTTDAAGRCDVQIPYTQSHPQQPITPSNVVVSANCDGYCGPNVTAEVGTPREIDATVRLERAATVEGRVLDPRGEPLGGARCSVGGNTAYTDRAGRFRIVSIPPGTVELDVSSERSAGLRRQGIQLRGGETLSLGDLALGEGAELTGRVVDALGNPVARYKVWLRRGPETLMGTIDAQGGFTITGLDPGSIYEGGVLAGGVLETISQVPAGGRDFVVTLKPAGGLEGRVTLEDGGPVPIRLHVDCDPVGRAERADIPPSFKSFTDGTFRATLPAGRYRLSVYGDPWLFAEPLEVEVTAGAVARVALVAKTGGVIEGRAQWPDGATARLVAVTKAGSKRSTLSRSHTEILAGGTYKVGPLEPGRYVLAMRVYEVGIRGTRQFVDVRAGETARCDLAVVATGGLVVTGLNPDEEMALLFADGAPAACEGMEQGQIAALLGGMPTEQEIARAATHADAQGVWRRFELIPGTYRVMRGGEALAVEIRPGETTSLPR